jgi:hypothetical protein
MARPGAAKGAYTDRKTRHGPAPSIIAASPRSFGMPRKYWRIRKVPKAVGKAGTMRPSRVSVRPIVFSSRKTGTIVTCNGTIIVARTSANSGFLKRNSRRAKA